MPRASDKLLTILNQFRTYIAPCATLQVTLGQETIVFKTKMETLLTSLIAPRKSSISFPSVKTVKIRGTSLRLGPESAKNLVLSNSTADMGTTFSVEAEI